MNIDMKSVELSFWNDDGENFSLDLEPWQVRAIFNILGLKINNVTPPNSTTAQIEYTMYAESTVNELMKRLPAPYQKG